MNRRPTWSACLLTSALMSASLLTGCPAAQVAGLADDAARVAVKGAGLADDAARNARFGGVVQAAKQLDSQQEFIAIQQLQQNLAQSLPLSDDGYVTLAAYQKAVAYQANYSSTNTESLKQLQARVVTETYKVAQIEAEARGVVLSDQELQVIVARAIVASQQSQSDRDS